MAKANKKARESGNFWTKRFDQSGNFISKMKYIKRQKKTIKPNRKANKELKKKYGIKFKQIQHSNGKKPVHRRNRDKSQKLKKQIDYGFKLSEWWMMQHA